jgi:hypothetical protein
MNNFSQSLQNLLQEGLDHKIISHKELVYASCQVAKSVLHLVPKGENRPRIAIETTERWCENEATLGEVMHASNNAYMAFMGQSSPNEFLKCFYYATCTAYDSASVSAYEAARAVEIVAECGRLAVDYALRYDHDIDYLSQYRAETKTLMLSHLPKLQKLKVWL